MVGAVTAIRGMLFASNKIFLPITVLDNGRFGNDADDKMVDECDADDEFDALDAVDVHAVVNCDVESSSSLRLLAIKNESKRLDFGLDILN